MRTVAAGQRYLSPNHAESLLDSLLVRDAEGPGRADDPYQLLSAREREVLWHIVQGKLNKQTAAALGIHERTVKLHRTHLTNKLGVHSVAELTRMVQAAGIFPWLSPAGDPC